jgi:uncharacterized protein (TIGR03000 family)
MTRLAVASILAVVVAISAGAQEKKAAPATIKLLIPDKPTKTEVTIEGKKQEEPAGAKDGARVFVTPDLDPSKTYAYKIEVKIVPNNYTEIFRTREVTFKAGETVTVDVRTEDKSIKDKIVVRWVPTPDDIVDKMCEMAKVGKDDVVHDYGCGDAVMLIRAVKKFGAKKGFGTEYDPKIIEEKALPKIREEKVEDKVKVVQGDINKMTEKECEEATVVLLYIGDDLGAKLSPILQRGLKPGARVVSHRFTLGDWKPDKTITVMGADGDEYTLHLWTVPEPKKKGKK